MVRTPLLTNCVYFFLLLLLLIFAYLNIKINYFHQLQMNVK